MMRDEVLMKMMRLLPKSALSTLVGKATRAKAPKVVHQLAMRAFARRFEVAMEEAEQGFEGYDTFAQFFTRRLRPGLRPIAEGEKVVVSPVDGAVSQVGYAASGQLLQAKGISFPVGKLLGDEQKAQAFSEGAFATLYLSPRDYHRIHSPLMGEIVRYQYLPGQFWPVNRASVRLTDALFAINERLVTYLRTNAGEVAVVAVGATCVSRIHAAYDSIITHEGQPATGMSYPTPIAIRKGEELAMFEMGSTVILLFENGRVRWDEGLVPDRPVKLGERLGVCL